MKQLSATGKNLKEFFKNNGVKYPMTDEQIELFAQFYRFLMDYQKKYNLTRLTSFHDVALKHFVDCIYVKQLMPDLPDPLVDMGTGAGFPGIPLKILSPDTRIILCEGVQKKVDYLKELREHLGLKKLDIIGRNVDPRMQYPVKGVITRAVETSAATLKNVINTVQVGGLVILMKTPGIDNEIKEAVDTMGYMYEIIMNKDYRLGNTPHERKLLVFKKTKPNTTEAPALE